MGEIQVLQQQLQKKNRNIYNQGKKTKQDVKYIYTQLAIGVETAVD